MFRKTVCILWRTMGRRASITALILVWLRGAACAFDTGHHFDLTSEVMREEGFGNTAVQVTQVENWLVDYYSTSPTSSMISDGGRLHFDNLFTTGRIRDSWGRLAYNTRKEVQAAAKAQDTMRLLTVLGISLHAVQDFYTHSNWVELHPSSTGAFRTETWFDAPLPDGACAYTGSWPTILPGATELHGDYKSGLNHDSYVRPRWAEAYVFAYAATRQWVIAVHQWVNEVDPGTWNAAQRFEVSGSDRSGLDRDLEAAYRLSEWVNSKGANGHWKGSGSGDTISFATAAAWVAQSDSRFVREIKSGLLHAMAEGLSADGGPITVADGAPTVPHVTLNRRAVIVRTLRVKESKDVGLLELKIDPGGAPDFYAKITVSGQTFTEAMQLDEADISTAWTTIRFVPASVATDIPVHYELWDEDGGARGGDDHCDINPARRLRNLDFDFSPGTHQLSGDISGVHDSERTATTSGGAKPDGNRAIVTFYVTERSLSEVPPSPA